MEFKSEFDWVAFDAVAPVAPVGPAFGMILNGPILFNTSDLNSMVSYDFGISFVSVYLIKIYSALNR